MEMGLEKMQSEAEEVKVIMLDNLNKVDERGEKLSDLDVRADELMEKGKLFEKKSVQVKQKQKGNNKKMKMVFIGIGVVAGLVILGLIIFACV
ncbi:vesicle-associated membrane protein 5 [Menidia menidia]